MGKMPINLTKEQVIYRVSSKSTFEKMYQVLGLPKEEISREGVTQPAPHRANCSHQDLLILSGPKSQCSSFRISGIRTSGVRVSCERNSHASPNPEPRNSEALDSCHLSAMINGSRYFGKSQLGSSRGVGLSYHKTPNPDFPMPPVSFLW